MFITFEGIDGVGKSTQLDLLETWLKDLGHDVVRTLEPGGTELGKEIRHLLLHRKGDVSPRAEALLYAADRAHHVATKIKPSLTQGKTVLSDRYFDSSVAYQGAARDLEVDEVKNISLWAVDHLMPDLTILLDLPADQAILRRNKKGTEPDRLEREEVAFFERARDEYLRRAEEPRFLVIDAKLAVHEIQALIRTRVSQLSAAGSS
ncbi:dTMP kinase [Candidatus Aquiluna sp. UB-MaderosW2red]|uniref:dTMP kinase n=1 Tax=Candidatus Aquiluna sp. UB-MaderosW2red TaxID=1855377 RepID=UPI000875BAA0|nr:dTMP kinase [Candidatus Aquiluna sp. UB-MaderosW2red]SCX14638.1 dTMP kinase [Candidatus Aquiluna sp. UB-MaderosW2red]